MYSPQSIEELLQRYPQIQGIKLDEPCCPITYKLFNEIESPVILLNDGKIYEKADLIQWLSKNYQDIRNLPSYVSALSPGPPITRILVERRLLFGNGNNVSPSLWIRYPAMCMAGIASIVLTGFTAIVNWYSSAIFSTPEEAEEILFFLHTRTVGAVIVYAGMAYCLDWYKNRSPGLPPPAFIELPQELRATLISNINKRK